MAIKQQGVGPVQVQFIDCTTAAVLVNPGQPAFGDGDLANSIAIRFSQPANQTSVGQSPCPAGPAAAIS